MELADDDDVGRHAGPEAEGSVAELTASECLDALRSSDVGRLALAASPSPDVFPVNYVVDHGTVVFRTAAGTKLHALQRDEAVTFEADGYDRSSGRAWSVVVKGRAVEIASLHERFDALELPLFPWPTSRKDHLVRVEPVVMTGRRFEATPSSAQARRRPRPPRSAPE